MPNSIARPGRPTLNPQVNSVQSASPLAPRSNHLCDEAKWIKSQLADDAKSGVASMTILVAKNAVMEVESFDYGTRKPQKATVIDAPDDGILDLTVLMSVSGHTGDADKYAKLNEYIIEVIHPEGTRERLDGVKANGEYCTAQNISFELGLGVTTIQAWPKGSAGPGGYVEGRVIKVHWEGY